jgi:hypothetical protein
VEAKPKYVSCAPHFAADAKPKIGMAEKWADLGNNGNNLTIVKKRGCVANFFHSGPSACHNSMEFRALWRQTTVKNAFAVFHSGPMSFTMPWQVLP